MSGKLTLYEKQYSLHFGDAENEQIPQDVFWWQGMEFVLEDVVYWYCIQHWLIKDSEGRFLTLKDVLSLR